MTRPGDVVLGTAGICEPFVPDQRPEIRPPGIVMMRRNERATDLHSQPDVGPGPLPTRLDMAFDPGDIALLEFPP